MIRLFVCCHQQTQVPKHPLLVPIQVGAALAGARFPGFIHDDDGENISTRNRSYCELTAQYWAWKNVEADHYGFFHYGRYLYPEKNVKRPYRIEGKASRAVLDRLHYDGFGELIQQYDWILPKGEDLYITVREHYARSPAHHKRDLILAEQIVAERYPEMQQAMQAYLSGTVHYFGNIYIMCRPVFHRYCQWLFSILEEFDRRGSTTGYSTQAQRVNGYLAERLLGIYYFYFRDSLRSLELPRVHFLPKAMQRSKRRLLAALLPPGSRRRAAVKGLLNRGCGAAGKGDVYGDRTVSSDST